MLKVTVDADKLTHWATELSERGMRNAIRRAVDKSATAARKVAVEIIAADIGVPKARIKDAVSKVRRTTQTNLSASFTASKMRVSMLATTGANVNNPGGLTGSTFRLTGGGSASPNVKEAFIVNANGGRFVAVRRSKSRLPIKGVFAETPSTALGQPGAAAQVAWTKGANKQLAERLPAEIQRQLVSEGIPYSAPADTD
jgi:hypothetical protein